MSDEEGDKENVGMVSGMSSVDVERVSRDGTTLNMSGDDSSEGEVNDRLAGSSRRHGSPEAQVERGTELDVNASSGRGFLSDSSEDSDATRRHRVKSKFSKRLSSQVVQVNKLSVPRWQSLCWPIRICKHCYNWPVNWKILARYPYSPCQGRESPRIRTSLIRTQTPFKIRRKGSSWIRTSFPMSTRCTRNGSRGKTFLKGVSSFGWRGDSY